MPRSTALVAERQHIGMRQFVAPVLFAALVAVAGQIKVPIPGTPVPVTLQVVIVLLAAAYLTPLAAAGSMLLFMTMGLLGAPVFSGGGAGLAHLLGPTGGYILGFVVGAALGSYLLAGRSDSLPRVLLSMVIVIGVIHTLGVLHLALYIGGDLETAFLTGSLPFLPLALVKTALAASIVYGGSSFFARDAGRHDRWQ